MIIDTHAHIDLGDNNVISRMLDDNLVDVIAISSLYGGAFPTLDELRRGNDRVLSWMESYPGRVIGFAYADPRKGEDGLRELHRCIDAGMKGMKLWISVLADDSRVDPYIEIAAKFGVVTLAHAWVKTTGNLPFESVPQNVANLAKRFPEAKFMLAHFGGEWEAGAKAARGCPNLYVDISGSLTEMDMVETLVDHVGIERVLFGTDNSNFHYCLGKVVGSRLPEEKKEMILWKNAKTLFSL